MSKNTEIQDKRHVKNLMRRYGFEPRLSRILLSCIISKDYRASIASVRLNAELTHLVDRECRRAVATLATT